jgi:hypothetical protein
MPAKAGIQSSQASPFLADAGGYWVPAYAGTTGLCWFELKSSRPGSGSRAIPAKLGHRRGGSAQIHVRKRNLHTEEFVVQGTSGRLCDRQKFGSVSVRTVSLSHFAGGFGIAFAKTFAEVRCGRTAAGRWFTGRGKGQSLHLLNSARFSSASGGLEGSRERPRCGR